MINRLSNIIAFFFDKNKWIRSEEIEIYIYGCEVIIAGIINILIVIACGLYFKEFTYMIIFYFAFLLLRRYCGGYHADTYWKCILIFTGVVVFTTVLIKKYVFLGNSFVIISVIFSLIVMYCLSPLENENKQLTESEKKRYRKLSLEIALGLCIIAIILSFLELKLSVTISIALFSVSDAMIVEKIIRYGGE